MEGGVFVLLELPSTMSSWRAIKRSRSLPFVLLLTLAFSAYSFLPSLRIPSDSPARPRLTEPQWAELVRSSSALCDDPFRAPGILTLNWDNLFRIFYDPAEGISHKIQMGPIFDHSGKQSNYAKGKGGSCLDRPGLGGPRLLERLVRVSRKEENEKGELNDSDLVIDEEDGEFKGVGFLRGNTVALLGEEQDYNHLSMFLFISVHVLISLLTWGIVFCLVSKGTYVSFFFSDDSLGIPAHVALSSKAPSSPPTKRCTTPLKTDFLPIE